MENEKFLLRPMTDGRLLRLHPLDNVLTLIRRVEAGEELLIEDAKIRVASTILLGHKVAARAIAAGEKIVKYGAPIGSARCDIARGEHVHTHNLQSDYLPTWLRDDQSAWFRQQH